MKNPRNISAYKNRFFDPLVFIAKKFTIMKIGRMVDSSKIRVTDETFFEAEIC